MTTSTARRADEVQADKPLWLQLKERGFHSEDILEWFEIRSPPIPITSMLKDLGVRVHEAQGVNWEGAVSSSAEGKADVWVRDDSAPARRRFTLAHELGHLMLHATGVMFRDITTGTLMHPPEEREANAFAAALLMPRALVQPLVYEPGMSIADMADLFAVSLQAMSIRLDWIRKGRRDL